MTTALAFSPVALSRRLGLPAGAVVFGQLAAARSNQQPDWNRTPVFPVASSLTPRTSVSAPVEVKLAQLPQDEMPWSAYLFALLALNLAIVASLMVLFPAAVSWLVIGSMIVAWASFAGIAIFVAPHCTSDF